MKYAKQSGITRYSGGTIVLRKNMSFDDAHPLVAERPDLFTEDVPPADMPAPMIERATRGPGEIRSADFSVDGPARRGARAKKAQPTDD